MFHESRTRTQILTLCLLALLGPVTANTALAEVVLEVSPVRINLTQNAPVAAVHVHNRSDEQAVVQLSAKSWDQRHGEDILDDTDLIISCPPIFTLEAGEEQVVRIALYEKHHDWSKQDAYRLFVQEVPQIDDSADNEVRFAVRISIPVFLNPSVVEKPELHWEFHQHDDSMQLSVHNHGGVHALVYQIDVQGEGIDTGMKTHKYVLPDRDMTWNLNELLSGSADLGDSIVLRVQTDQGEYLETLRVIR